MQIFCNICFYIGVFFDSVGALQDDFLHHTLIRCYEYMPVLSSVYGMIIPRSLLDALERVYKAVHVSGTPHAELFAGLRLGTYIVGVRSDNLPHLFHRRSGLRDRIRAATLATGGAAIDVPDQYAMLLFSVVDGVWLPGAQTNRYSPYDETSSNTPLLLIAPTDITSWL